MTHYRVTRTAKADAITMFPRVNSRGRMHNAFQVGDVTIGGGALFLIAGPCVIESEAHALKMAVGIAAAASVKEVR